VTGLEFVKDAALRFRGILARWTGVLAVNYRRGLPSSRSPFPRESHSGTAEELEQQLCWLKAHFDLISPREIPYVLRVRRGRHVVVTFDDGTLYSFTEAYPILRSHRVPATFFISTGLVDHPHLHAAATSTGRSTGTQDSSLWMTWDMIREMRANGMTIGGRGVEGRGLARMPRRAQYEEINECGRRMEEELGAPMRTFSYPVGQPDSFSPDTRDCLREAGVRSAFSDYGGFRRLEEWDDYDIPRLAIERGTPFNDFRVRILAPWRQSGTP
jgi:peptidoglycan/xylan/chitin deacetylase (PgdA/CDA1 family)